MKTIHFQLKKNTRLALMLGFLLTLTFGTINAQGDEKEKSGKISGGYGYFSLGYTQLDLGPTNTFMNGVNYSDFANNHITIGGGGFVMVKNLILGGEGHSLLSQEAKSTQQNALLSGGWGQFQIGYIVLARRGFILYPRFGVGRYNHSLLLTNTAGNSTNVNDFLNGNFNGTEIIRKGMLLSGELGFEFMPGFDENSGSGLTFGLNVGYNYAASSNAWTAYQVELQNGPDLNMSGIYARLRIGFGGWHRQ
ncbi:MAG TPA: hypothetical protein ENJ82_16365 [Bacteroidetes bacterium]|nr:hypothetical protein [Bacteroidota bacterium]